MDSVREVSLVYSDLIKHSTTDVDLTALSEITATVCIVESLRTLSNQIQ